MCGMWWVRCTHGSVFFSFFFQAEDGIRDLVRSRGLGDVYKRQAFFSSTTSARYALASVVVMFLMNLAISIECLGEMLSLIHI